jgi:hypothetical protein
MAGAVEAAHTQRGCTASGENGCGESCRTATDYDEVVCHPDTAALTGARKMQFIPMWTRPSGAGAQL